jgi:hypothetical protein
VQACTHPLQRSEREREREGGRKRERENTIHTIITTKQLKLNEIKLEIIYKRVRKREIDIYRERKGERCRILSRIVIFIFERNDRCLGTFLLSSI